MSACFLCSDRYVILQSGNENNPSFPCLAIKGSRQKPFFLGDVDSLAMVIFKREKEKEIFKNMEIKMTYLKRRK